MGAKIGKNFGMGGIFCVASRERLSIREEVVVASRERLSIREWEGGRREGWRLGRWRERHRNARDPEDGAGRGRLTIEIYR